MKTNAATGAIENAGTKATDFEKYCTAKLEPAGTALGTPLVMTGSGTTKILGNIATVNIELKRRVSRFDIDNESAKTGLIIESVALGNGRNQATVIPGTLTTLDNAGRTASLIKYPVAEGSYLMLPKANQGVTESALYTYPLKDTDEAPPSSSSKANTRTRCRKTLCPWNTISTYSVLPILAERLHS